MSDPLLIEHTVAVLYRIIHNTVYTIPHYHTNTVKYRVHTIAIYLEKYNIQEFKTQQLTALCLITKIISFYNKLSDFKFNLDIIVIIDFKKGRGGDGI